MSKRKPQDDDTPRDGSVPALFGDGAPMTFTDHLKAGFERGMTVEFIARQAGVTSETVKRWACGKSRPVKEVERAVMRVLGGEVVALDGGEPQPADPARSDRQQAPSTPVARDHQSRVETSKEALNDMRAALVARVAAGPTGPEPVPEANRPAPADATEPSELARRHYHHFVRAADVSPTVFGTAAPDTVEPFEVPGADAEVPEDLVHLSRLSRIDYRATLAGRVSLPWLTGARAKDGGRKRVKRGTPSSVPGEVMMRVAGCLDRFGLATSRVIAAFVSPHYPKATQRALTAMVEHGLIEYIALREERPVVFGRMPRIYRLTGKGFAHLVSATGRKKYEPNDTVSRTGLSFLAHHVGAASYTVQLLDTLPFVTGDWCTPAWPAGHLDVPIIHTPNRRGRTRQPLTPDTAYRSDRLSVVTTLDAATDLKPDALLWLEACVNGISMRLPLMVEYDLTGEIPHNLDKLLNYEAWRLAIMHYHPAFADLGDNLGATLIVVRHRRFLLDLMRAADQGHTTRQGIHRPALSGSLSLTGTPLAYYAFRENLFFALEEDIYRGSLRVFQIPPCPPNVRAKLGQSTEFFFFRTMLLPPADPALRGKRGRTWTADHHQPIL